jgi:hypothetical protein
VVGARLRSGNFFVERCCGVLLGKFLTSNGEQNLHQWQRGKGECMEIDYKNMKIEELESICAKAEKYLTNLLLNGAPWRDVQQQMLLVTQVSIAIHKNKYPVK